MIKGTTTSADSDHPQFSARNGRPSRETEANEKSNEKSNDDERSPEPSPMNTSYPLADDGEEDWWTGTD